MSACNKIRHIVRLRQTLLRCRKNSARRSPPSDVPSGHVAVRVGPTSKRFVVRAAYLNHPVFEKLLVLAEEEYGFANSGPLVIPCDESVFEEILLFLSQSDSARLVSHDDFQRYCWADSQPLLNGLTNRRLIRSM